MARFQRNDPTISASDLIASSRSELLHIVKGLQKQVSSRVSGLKEADVIDRSPALDKLRRTSGDYGTTDLISANKGLTRNQLLREASRALEFLKSKTSTAGGVEAVRREEIERLTSPAPRSPAQSDEYIDFDSDEPIEIHVPWTDREWADHADVFWKVYNRCLSDPYWGSFILSQSNNDSLEFQRLLKEEQQQNHITDFDELYDSALRILEQMERERNEFDESGFYPFD